MIQHGKNKKKLSVLAEIFGPKDTKNLTKKIVNPWNDYDNITPLVLVWERPLKISRRFWHFKLRPLVHTMRQQRLTWLAFSRTRSCCCWPSTPNVSEARSVFQDSKNISKENVTTDYLEKRSSIGPFCCVSFHDRLSLRYIARANALLFMHGLCCM